MIRTRLGYTLLLLLLLPGAMLHLARKARRQPAYLRHVKERFGFYDITPEKLVIWLHAVSVGETRAAEPLIKSLQEAYPQHQILLTHMTPTGRETGEMLSNTSSTWLNFTAKLGSWKPMRVPGDSQARNFRSAARRSRGSRR